MDINLNGEQYYVNVTGSGRPLLLLHGFTGSSANWEPIAHSLARQHQLVMPDLLGHGQTAAPAEPERYGMAEAAADLATLLDTLEIEQVYLVGYSMGGRLALYFTLHYPERVRSLILESSSPGLKMPDERLARREQDNRLAERIEREGIEAFVDFWEGLSLWASQQAVSVLKRQALRAQRLKNRPKGLANSLRGMGTGIQPSLWNQLGQVGQPTLLLTGLLDKKFVEINRRMCVEIPTAAQQIISHAGHTIHFERPQVYSERVLAFLRQYP